MADAYDISLHAETPAVTENDATGAVTKVITPAVMPVVGDDQTKFEANYTGYVRVQSGKGNHVMFPAIPVEIHKPQYITHAAIGRNGKIEKVVKLTPPILTQGGHAPVLFEPDLIKSA